MFLPTVQHPGHLHDPSQLDLSPAPAHVGGSQCLDESTGLDRERLLGLPRALAADLIVQTALGAAVMMRDSGEHPVQLREAVTSPGGTTIAAIRELERHGVRAALIAAIEAAHARSVELGGGKV